MGTIQKKIFIFLKTKVKCAAIIILHAYQLMLGLEHLFGAPKHGLNPQKRNADLFEVVRTDCQMILGNVGKKKGKRCYSCRSWQRLTFDHI